MIHLEERHWKILQDILSKYPYTFYAFGSRATGKEKRLSDVNLCFIEPIPDNIQAHIEEDFEESDLPFKVDLVDWNRISSDFQNRIRKDLKLLQKGANFKASI